MKHLTNFFLTLSLIVTLVLGVLVDAASKRPAPRVQNSIVKKQKPRATNQSAPNPPVSGHLPLPSTPDVVVVDTTVSAGISGDLSWLFTKVHYTAILVGIPLVLKTSYDISLEEASLRQLEALLRKRRAVMEGEDVVLGMENIFMAEPKEGKNSDRIKRVVEDVFMSLGKPKVHSLALYSLLVSRFIPSKFTLESLFGLNKYIDPATFKFARLVASFCFFKYSYRVHALLKDPKLSETKLTFIARSTRWLQCLFPVTAMVGAALNEVIWFFFAIVSKSDIGETYAWFC